MTDLKLGLDEVDVCMIAYNEELFIEKSLRALQPYFNNIYVLDMESTDRTIEIVKDVYGDRSHIITQPRSDLLKHGFAYSRNKITDATAAEWVLHVDADEILQPLATPEISLGPEEEFKGAAKVARRNLTGAAPKDFDAETLAQADIISREEHARLYKKSPTTLWRSFLHEELFVEDRRAAELPTLSNLTLEHVSAFKPSEELQDKEYFYAWICVQVYDNPPLQDGMREYYLTEFIPKRLDRFRYMAGLYAAKQGL